MSVNLTVEANFTGWVTRNVDSVTPDSGALCVQNLSYISAPSKHLDFSQPK